MKSGTYSSAPRPYINDITVDWFSVHLHKSCNNFANYRSRMVNLKSFVGKVLL